MANRKPIFVGSRQDTPEISASTYSATSYSPTSAMGLGQLAVGSGYGGAWTTGYFDNPDPSPDEAFHAAIAKAIPTAKQENSQVATRLVKVVIVDSDDNLPLANRLIYSGEEKMTDLTDQELFFEIDIKSLLDKHNEMRVQTPNKSVKERPENLEPVRIKDLKMVVVNIAHF